MARDMVKSFVNGSVAYSHWFERFLKKTHKKIGDNVRVDLAMIAIQESLEKRLVVTKTGEEQQNIEELLCFLLVGNCVWVRGDKIHKLDLGGFVKHQLRV